MRAGHAQPAHPAQPGPHPTTFSVFTTSVFIPTFCNELSRNNTAPHPITYLPRKVASRRAALDVHEWEGRFRGQPARFKMTSVSDPSTTTGLVASEGASRSQSLNRPLRRRRVPMVNEDFQVLAEHNIHRSLPIRAQSMTPSIGRSS